MSEAKLIGSSLKLAYDHLQVASRIGPTNRMAPISMFYAAENILTAIFTSENADFSAARRKYGNHQLDRMIDELPNDCRIKSRFEDVVGLVAYATTYRYASSTGKISEPPGDNEANGYFDALVEILDICARHFEVDVTLDQPQAGSVLPMR